MQKIFVFSILVLSLSAASAQDFIFKGTIVYEQKVSELKKMGHRSKEAAAAAGMSHLSEYSITQRRLLFSGNKTAYLPMPGQEEQMISTLQTCSWTDLDAKKAVFRANNFFYNHVFEDSLKTMRWKIEDETRNIAGFKCRKAVGVMLDSVYVVAFYCAEIPVQGGPEIFNGLPGMILGLAIPRMYTTWFATSVQAAAPEEKEMGVTLKKGEKMESIDVPVGFWKDVIKKSGTPDIEHLKTIVKGLPYNVPGGD